jgi:hypothetical protein
MRIAGIALAVVCVARPCGAEWALTAYAGAAHTNPNTLNVEPSTGGALHVHRVVYEGRSWNSPIYYGGRLTYFFKERRWLGVELEFTHLKAIADTSQFVRVNEGAPAPLAGTVQRFELSHGLNLVFANAVVRKQAPGASGKRLTLTARGGLGPTLPHVEATFGGVTRDEYQRGGLAGHVSGGLEWRVAGDLSAVIDLRFSQARERIDLGAGTLRGTFASRHLDFGIGWKFGRRSSLP